MDVRHRAPGSHDEVASRSTPEHIRNVNTRYHDAAAPTYDTKWAIDFGPTGQRQVQRKLRKAIGADEPRRSFRRSLEIGAGTGYFTLNLMKSGLVAEATATDISPGMLAQLRENARSLGLAPSTVCADAESLPFADASFDLVVGHAVLHHLPDLERAFAEFVRVLAPGGRLVFAGEPSRLGDRLAAIPKRSGVAAAPLWRAAMRAAAAPPGRPAAAPPDPAAVAPTDRTAAAPPDRAAVASTNGASADGPDDDLERWVDIHAFTPVDLARLAAGAGLRDVTVRGEELVANWFGWFNRVLEASAEPDDVPMLWRQYAFRGYLLLQRLDERVLEPLLPPAVFYNLLLAARKPEAPLD